MIMVHAAQVGQGGPVRIASINLAKTDLRVSFDELTATLQKCFDQHFPQIWGYPVRLYNTLTWNVLMLELGRYLVLNRQQSVF